MITQHVPTTIGRRSDATTDDGAADFAAVRRRLFGIAYRMLGSWAEAEDIVQDVWVRWQAYDRTTVLNPTAFLVTTTTRLAINAIQSARMRRESYVGEWVHEAADASVDPASRTVQSEELGHGIQLLVERLSPAERAAYVLREAFDYPYAKIAGLLHVSEVNARQLVSRAGKNLAAGQRESAARAPRRQLETAFLAAARTGEFDTLEELFARESGRRDYRETASA
jgi:RNA polymerase sigma-70 factor, ECF subfamily